MGPVRYRDVMEFARIATSPDKMGGVPCLRDLRFPVATDRYPLALEAFLSHLERWADQPSVSTRTAKWLELASWRLPTIDWYSLES